MPTIQLLIVFINLFFSLIVLFKDLSNINNRLFSIMALLAVPWSFATYMIETSDNIIWLKISYSLGSLLLSSGLIWTFYVTRHALYLKRILGITLICAALPFSSNFKLGLVPTFMVQMFFYFYFSILIINRFYCHWKVCTASQKNIFKYLTIGSFLTLTVIGVDSFIFPILGIFTTASIDSISFVFFICIIAFMIIRYELFNIKVIGIHVVSITLLMFLLIRVLSSNSIQVLFTNLFIFILTTSLSILLIKKTVLSIMQREQIKSLSNNLSETYKYLESKTEAENRVP